MKEKNSTNTVPGKKERLPLIEFTNRLFEDNSRYKVVACPHYLESNAQMLLSLVDKGFDPEKMCVIPKAYSHNREVAEKFRTAGIRSWLEPFYHSHWEFDELHRDNVERRLRAMINKFGPHNYMLIDDGGELIRAASETESLDHSTCAGVEQTSSGYNRLKDRELPFPVVNIARSKSKLDLESPHIAEIVVSRLEDYLAENRPKEKYETLILGAGFIGLSIREKLGDKYIITLYDTNGNEADIDALKPLLQNKDVVIGCTGKVSVPKECHQYIRGSVLVNAASSDREFDAAYLREKFPRNRSTHRNYDLGKIGLDGAVLLNSGFPLTFLGNREEGNSKIMQLTHSLMLAGVLSLTKPNSYKNGFNPLNPALEERIRKKYQSMI